MANQFLQLVFKSDIKILRLIEKEILSFLTKEAELSEEELLEFKLIINELLINAIVHGNRNNPSKKVKVKIGVYEKRLSYIVVEDEGDGFDIEKVFTEYTPCEEADQIEGLYEFGRGLMIVSSLCESVKQNRKGNKIVALRRLKAEEAKRV